MDFFMSKVTEIIQKFSKKMDVPVIPWENLKIFMRRLDEYLADANMIFPVDTILTIMIILLGIFAVLLFVWALKFIRDLLPF